MVRRRQSWYASVHVFVDGWIGDVSFASLSLYWTYNHSTPANVEELLGFFTLMGEKRYRVLICPFNDFVHIFKEGLFMAIRSFITLTQCWFNCHSRSVYLTSLHLLMFVYVKKRNERIETCNIPLTTLQDFGFTCFSDPMYLINSWGRIWQGELVKSRFSNFHPVIYGVGKNNTGAAQSVRCVFNACNVVSYHHNGRHHKAIWTVVGGNTITGHLYLGDQFTLIMTLMVFNTYQKSFLP